MDKQYNPKNVEEKTYKWWEDQGYFTPDPDDDSPTFCIVIPPPNVTGKLHVGHALNNTIQDIVIRFKRMKGFNTVWVPGCDHAGIATHAVVEKQLKEEGTSRYEIGRDKFVERVWEWKKEYGDTIMRQLRFLGCSLDWTRERFTLDQGLSKAVEEVFLKLYEDGLIYKGKYIVNWCPGCNTAISNIETEYSEKQGHLWYIKYPVIKDSDDPEIPDYLIVATTRPETMLGDTGVAIHPDEEKYKKLHGLKVRLPLANREIPVIVDARVELGFGTGAVKVTPAHDPLDFELGRDHKLDMPIVIDLKGKMTGDIPGKYIGLDRFKARKEIVKDLESEGLIEKIEDYQHSVGHCDRCKTDIEPIISDQWFVKMKPLAEPAIEIVEKGEIEFVPDRWKNYYLNWMYNIRDWCISRQLWWGHRIPIWYCKDNDHVVASSDKPATCPECGCKEFKQEEDVLDTWFSSQLWPFSVLGWPEDTEDMKKYYPTSLLVTDRGIIFLWVARMIMAGLRFMNEKPFNQVYIHGTVLDEQGRKMSKSLGNGIDPIEMIEQYGADAVRFSLMMLTSTGQDIYLSENKFQMGRNFANKLWNASRFVMMNIDDKKLEDEFDFSKVELVDKWILSRLTKAINAVDASMDEYKFNNAASTLYDFVWKEFCDWYLELCKPRLSDPDDQGFVQYLLLYLLSNILRMLHPFMPYITEEIYHKLPEQFQEFETIMLSDFPEPEEDFEDQYSEYEMNIIIELINKIRQIRSEMVVPIEKQIKILIRGKDSKLNTFVDNNINYIKKLAKVQAFEIGTDITRPPQSAAGVVSDFEVFIPLGDLIDIEKEQARIEKNIEELGQHLTRSQNKLQNKNFLTRAPGEVVEKEKVKKAELEQKIEKLRKNLDFLK